ncbi:MAG: polysaccharide deacetylase family protein [Pseudomonadota bacterium]|jgi:peptidoglycan/xylan/chitin deacetylase (PgdA/CDA1 family)|nr:polysaccharide deacetylase family protein [Alphaproteobacteria bacterium]
MIFLIIALAIGIIIFLAHYNFWRPVRNSYWPRILMYHDTSENLPSGMNVTPEKLKKQIRYLLGKGYIFLKISDLLNFDRKEKHVVLTFDDGFVGNYTHLFDILKRYNVPATIYLTPKIKDIKMLNAKQIKEMQNSGLVEFGAHTMTHVNLKKVNNKIAQKEIVESKKAVEKLTGVNCQAFAYPYGRYNDEHVEMVKDAGFSTAVTTKKAINSFSFSNAYTLPRLSIDGRINMLQFYLILSRGRYKI